MSVQLGQFGVSERLILWRCLLRPMCPVMMHIPIRFCIRLTLNLNYSNALNKTRETLYLFHPRSSLKLNYKKKKKKKKTYRTNRRMSTELTGDLGNTHCIESSILEVNKYIPPRLGYMEPYFSHFSRQTFKGNLQGYCKIH